MVYSMKYYWEKYGTVLGSELIVVDGELVISKV